MPEPPSLLIKITPKGAGGGNLFCLDTGSGEIYFWDHEQEAAEDEAPPRSNLFLAADSFAAFLEKLQKFESYLKKT